jgi:hypothetical protein
VTATHFVVGVIASPKLRWVRGDLLPVRRNYRKECFPYPGPGRKLCGGHLCHCSMERRKRVDKV